MRESFFIRKNLLVLCLISIAGIGVAQTSTNEPEQSRSNVEINFGIIKSRLIDQGYTESRLKFRGTNAKFGLGYNRSGASFIFRVALQGSAGTVQSKSGDLPSDFYMVKVSAEYLRKVNDHRIFAKENQVYIGLHASSMNYALQNDPVVDNLDIVSLHRIYLGMLEKLKLNEQQSLQVSYLLPAMVYENRVLWNGGASSFTVHDRDHPLALLTGHGQTSFFTVTRNVQLKVDYIAGLGKNTDLTATYGFIYLNNFERAPFRMYSNELLVGLKFKF